MSHSNDQPDYIGYPALQTIDYALTNEDGPGYEAHAACTLDGFPGEVIISVDTRRPEFSRFEAKVFDDRRYEWKVVYSLTPEQARHYVGHLGVVAEYAETLTQLNRLARILRAGGDAVMRAGRERRQAVMLDYERQMNKMREASVRAKLDAIRDRQNTKVTIPAAADLGPQTPGNTVVALPYEQAQEFAADCEADLRGEPDDIQEG